MPSDWRRTQIDMPFSLFRKSKSPIDPLTIELKKHRLFAFSQEGEDLLINRILNNKSEGFFIDIGAHHPIRFSNTYFFYRKGWRGINVDAMPGAMKAFEQFRPEDTNIEAAVSNKAEQLTYFRFNEPALNTFVESEALKKDGLQGYRIEERISIQTTTLAELISKYLPEGKEVDFLTIDVEGLDLAVLESNDWSRVKPKLIVVEDLTKDLDLILKNSATKTYLESKGYRLFSKMFNTCMYLRED